MNPAYTIKHNQILVGKDFKIILKVAPFVFFKLMQQEQRLHWTALCMLSTYVFTTKIDDMPTYVAKICKHHQITLPGTPKPSKTHQNPPKPYPNLQKLTKPSPNPSKTSKKSTK